MAIGDVQNRFGAQNQIPQISRNTNDNQPQVRPRNQEVDTGNRLPENRTGSDNTNVIHDQNTGAGQNNRNTVPAGLNSQDSFDLNPQAGLTQTNQPQPPPETAPDTPRTGRRSDENVLLNTNNVQERTPPPSGRGENDNTVNNAVERTANKQISNIQENNSSTAASTPQLTAALNALTQENQLGAKVDTFA